MNTLFDKLWNLHTVEEMEDGNYLLAIDRIYLHDLCGMFSFQMLDANKMEVLRKRTVYAMPDHSLASKKGRDIGDSEMSRCIIPKFRQGCEKYGITLFDLGNKDQGIVHIVGPETGLSLPGMSIVCGDSHTCTHGALGALAMGVGTSEVYHALATSCLIVKKPKNMRIILRGKRRLDVGPMDIALYLLSKAGIDFGVGYAVEYAGNIVSEMSMDERCTLCNMTIEMGAEYGIISPDEKTIEYVKSREYAPKGENLTELIKHCDAISTNEDSLFDKEMEVDVSEIRRQVSWGINPSHTIAVDGEIPYITGNLEEKTRKSYEKAYGYMNVKPGQKLEGTPIDFVFIGSCANGRLTYLAQIASLVKGKKVAPGVKAWIVPGSVRVQEEAQVQGWDKIFTEAGFCWGEPGCSLCVGSNGETIPFGSRCVSTTNRNFIGRQGRGARTHLASPVTAAMSAIAGRIV